MTTSILTLSQARGELSEPPCKKELTGFEDEADYRQKRKGALEPDIPKRAGVRECVKNSGCNQDDACKGEPIEHGGGGKAQGTPRR